MNFKKICTDYLSIAIGSFILALGINLFLVPFKISTGGVSGIGTIFLYLFNIPLSVTNLIINLILFALGYKLLPKSSNIKTLAGIIFLSLFLQLTSYLPSYNDDLLMGSLFGGVLVGIGVGLVVVKDASTGGSDFAGLMLYRIMPHISVAVYILLIDSLIIIISGIVFRDYTLTFYSVISVYISSKITDLILVRGDYAKRVEIISPESEKISDKIMKDMERGVTGIYSKGLYNGTDGMMLLCIVKNREVHHLMSIVREYDRHAFVTISDVKKVVGEGFREE